MTNTFAVIRFVQMSLTASVLGAALLIGSAPAGSATEITPTPISTTDVLAQAPAAAEPGTTAAPAQPVRQIQFTLPAAGAVGFGWG
jgi:hypothetical protein